ncbi:MAG: alpha-amylase [Calditrichaeota bacterium]|nr:alpha-amylase [Calditrichota bacterium]
MLLALFLIWGCGESTEETSQHPLKWAEGRIWYQIFPERFRNGDPSNDPTAEEVPEADLEPGWQIHPWTSDWYLMQPWELKRSSYFYDVVFTRRYGGDLIGVIEKLDYLKSLGVEGIYFNPIFEAPSLHKYDAASYHHIDDNFGPDPAGDKARIAAANETEDPSTWIWTKADSTFLKLIKEAHKRGIKVVIDGVFNHSGTQFFAFQDIVKNGKNSRYLDWYDILSWDDPNTPENEFDYKAWWGVKSLPEFAEDENGLKEGPRKYIFAITRRWMDPNGDGNPEDGVDGWRLDVTEEVSPVFWREWYAYVKSINPSAITISEIWGDASEWVKDRRVDGTMNYLFAKAVVRFFIDKKLAISPDEFAARLQEILDKYGRNAYLLWNLMDSHDTDRLASMIINPDREYDRMCDPRHNPDYDVRKPTEAERRVQKQIAAFQMTFVGAPMIYYGDEAGMWGADDPDDRKPMVWPEMTFDVEKSHPLGKPRPADENGFDEKLFRFYQKVIQIRKDNPVLRYGDYAVIPEATAGDGFGFKRWDEKSEVLALFNRAESELSVTIPQSRLQFQKYRDAMNGEAFSAEEQLQVTIPAKGFRILVANGKS